MKIVKRVFGIVLALFVAVVFLFPLLWVLLSSFKTKLELLAVPPVGMVAEEALSWASGPLKRSMATGAMLRTSMPTGQTQT